ncbi:hypothetical protein Fmac_011275 [Flemingia macrophylla]|uniref:Uncharacterized protein n=1 Tax=Flemingia macrophylla TaxID=520843 RepID=A0ABD1MM25_9FABA
MERTAKIEHVEQCLTTWKRENQEREEVDLQGRERECSDCPITQTPHPSHGNRFSSSEIGNFVFFAMDNLNILTPLLVDPLSSYSRSSRLMHRSAKTRSAIEMLGVVTNPQGLNSHMHTHNKPNLNNQYTLNRGFVASNPLGAREGVERWSSRWRLRWIEGGERGGGRCDGDYDVRGYRDGDERPEMEMDGAMDGVGQQWMRNGKARRMEEDKD